MEENSKHNTEDRKDSPLASPVTGSSRSDGGVIVHSTADQNDKQVTPAIGETDFTSQGNGASHRPTSFDFTEEIRRLEIEGNKLRAATISSLGFANITALSGLTTGRNESSFEIGRLPLSSNNITYPLQDITTDQKTISDLRVQLESQRRETEHLQKQLLGDVTGIRNLSSGSVSQNLSGGNNSYQNFSPSALSFSVPSPTKSAFSTIPSNELGSAFLRKQYDYQPPYHLERSLKESQEQVIDLRKRLQEGTAAADEQKKHFRTTIEELKTKLHETVITRDTVLDMREKESRSQDILLNKLQSSYGQLQEQHHVQEEVLASISKKFETQNQNSHSNDSTLEQICSILVDREKRRGGPFFETDPAATQTTTMYAHTLERCLQELDHEMNLKCFKAAELESDLESMKKTACEREVKTVKEFEDLITKLKADHEKHMMLENGQVTSAKQQLSILQTQLFETETQHKKELEEQCEQIPDLEDKIDGMKTEILHERTKWQGKRMALESSLDAVQKELIETKTEKNEWIQSQAALNVRATDFQTLISRLEGDLGTERDRVQQQRSREEDLRTKVMTLENQVANKQGDIDRLERMLDVVKQECSAQLVDKVTSVECLERDRYLDHIKSLSSQLATMTEKCNRITVEHQMSKSEMDSLRTQVHDLTEKVERARAQIESALLEKNDLTSVLGAKHNDLERLFKDKDHFSAIAEERATELRDLKLTNDRLKLQLEEKETLLNTFRQQSNNINQLMEVNSKTNENIREEKDRLCSALSEKSALYEEARSSHEHLVRGLKLCEKRLKEREEERVKLNEELALKSQELDVLQQEKDSVMAELRDSRLEVANQKTSKDTLKKELQRLKILRNKDVNKLQTKLKESEQEYRLSQKALRSKDIMDQKAVRFADKAQKEITVKRSEVDMLNSKMRRLEEKLETLSQEKAMVERDKDSLKRSLAKSLLHTQELSDELQIMQLQNQELVQRVAKLEESIEKAAFKSSASHIQMQKCEQEMAALKIKHQLDLKEAESHSSRSGQTSSYLTGSSMPSVIANLVPERDYNVHSTGRLVGTAEQEDLTGKNTLQIREERHREFSDVGQDLKNLLSEMRSLISNHKEQNNQANIPPSSLKKGNLDTNKAKTQRERIRSHLSSPLRMKDLGICRENDKDSHSVSDYDDSWASKSLSGQGDLSDLSSYKEWRPHSNSLSQHHRSFSSDLDLSHASTFLSKGLYSDVSRLSQSVGSPCKQYTHLRNSIPGNVPDTQVLCRRLEEKIDSLTKMGGNLQKENKEMADLINLQGEKLDTVKQIERKARELR